MAKDVITEYDATASNNTVCGDVNIAENSALPSDMNNFAREIMSHLKEGLGSGTPLYVDQTNNRVGINKTPTVALDVSGDANLSGTLDVTGAVTVGGNVGIGTTSPAFTLEVNKGSAGDIARFTDGVNANTVIKTAGSVTTFGPDTANSLAFQTNNGERMRITSAGNVGIGGVSPSAKLDVVTDSTNDDGISITADGPSFGYASNIYFNSKLTVGGSIGVAAKIRAALEGSNNAGLQFFTTLSGTNAERMRIDSSGNVGIGVTSLTQKLEVAGKGVFSTANPDVNGLQIKATTGTNASAMQFTNSVNAYVGLDNSTGGRFGSGNYGLVMYQGSPYPITFHTNGTERMRLDSSGNLMLGTTSSTGFKMDLNSGGGSGLFTQSIGSSAIGLLTRPDANHSYYACRFDNVSASIVGTISVGTGSTSYNTTSDYRVKENVVDMTDATTRLKQLQPKRFNFIADADTTVDGFLAHEVQSVVPEAITGTHNEVDADGNPVYQGIDQSKLVPLLVKTIQELEARITALENGE